MAVLTLLSFTAVKWASKDITRTKNYTQILQATYIAEAGIHRALNYFNYTAAGTSPGEAANGFSDELDGSNWPAGTFTSIAIGADGGTYTVTAQDNNDDDSDTSVDADYSIVLTSTGAIDGITVTVEAVIYRPMFKSEHAILSEGGVKVAGSSTLITGTNGSVHTNSNFTQSGGPTVSAGATASGTCPGDQCNGSGVAEEYVPVVEPSDYESYADYIFNADGTIYAQGTVIDISGNTLFSKFSHNAQGWSVGNSSVVGTSIPNQATLYFKDDFKATSVGDAATPWEATLIVEKSIAWTGSAYIKNWKDPALTEDLQNLFLIAGNDIKMSSMQQDTQGLIACKDQASLSGGANLEGYVISNNLTTSDNTVNESETDVSGGITLTYNGDLPAPFLSDKVTVLAWQKT
ncbi:MAG: hypothetical protein H8E42_10335 [Nitrospinae bacterium]|nr:hypothetical protein [Nitrospinota bacterium]MBL7019532.1 hypothetical protein [Nitrospinaceae bacterium]